MNIDRYSEIFTEIMTYFKRKYVSSSIQFAVSNTYSKFAVFVLRKNTSPSYPKRCYFIRIFKTFLGVGHIVLTRILEEVLEDFSDMILVTLK